MDLSLYLFAFMRLLFSLSILHLIPSHSSSFMQPLCHDDESSALLQFKESLIINKYASDAPWANPKVASWTPEGDNTDCCSWDGVECDEDTGHVIGLDLSSSFLYGCINSNSSLFRLVHLQTLNLAHNNFNYSQIPSQVRNLSRLTYLNLSDSMFSGQIPLQVWQLPQLSSLDLSNNHDFYYGKYILELRNSSLTNVLGNLTGMQKLHLDGVNIRSAVPNILVNLSSLKSLRLRDCGLIGEIPVGIFKLPNLQVLDVGYNKGLFGYLPEFTWSSPLEELNLALTNFLGELPTSIGNLGSLTILDVRSCNFSGFPSSLGNLTNLIHLDASNTAFMSKILSSIGNFTQLSFLDLSYNQLRGPIPFGLVNLRQLSYLRLFSNLFSGEIPFGLLNLTQLTHLDLGGNELQGRIPNSIFNLTNLEFLDLSKHHFRRGTVEFGNFVELKHLTVLILAGIQVSLHTEESFANATLPKFQYLDLSWCNLGKFPHFLKSQDRLELLQLSRNNIHGEVPEWMWNTSRVSLDAVFLGNNFLTGFAQHPILLPWTQLAILDLRSNLLQGSLPIPPVSTWQYYVSNNSLTGNISELICNLNALQVLDLADNKLSGSLPQCMHNFGDSLSVLDLQRNEFHGSIPPTWTKGSHLRIINFSQNKFQGQLPRSLASCLMLEVLDLSNNQFNDMFPSWLGNLPILKVLSLRANQFNGPIGTPKTDSEFPNLRIIDLSYNHFIGKLPLQLFGNWKAPKFENADHLRYIQVLSTSTLKTKVFGYYRWTYGYSYSMKMANKGINIFYEKVQEFLTVIDISSNRFVGEIPESIENLKGFRILNFSNNGLTGHIPPSLGNLAELESLDLSQNKFSGEIPQQLTHLTFLEFFDVSHNHLRGPIPEGKQFDTFDNISFEGNSGLCGRPLTRKCENSDLSPPPSLTSSETQLSGSPFEFGWKVVLIGYGFGLFVGVTIGNIVIARKHEWLMETFRIRQPVRRMVRRRGHRN